MEIVVNDTNVLIDLYEADLLKFCSQLQLEFHTLDVIVEEVTETSQREAVDSLVKEGTLKVHSLSGLLMLSVMEKVEEYRGACNLSPEDISVMLYAKENDFRLLTGDKTLRAKAILENVKVSGVLYLTDMMVENGIVEPLAMADALEKMIASNKRLPIKMICDKISELRSKNPSN